MNKTDPQQYDASVRYRLHTDWVPWLLLVGALALIIGVLAVVTA